MEENKFASLDDLMVGDPIGEEELVLPNGKVVLVRGLSAYTRKLTYKGVINANGDVDTGRVETRLLTYGLVKPSMNESQAEAYMKVASYEVVDAIITKIRQLSGLSEGADKS